MIVVIERQNIYVDLKLNYNIFAVFYISTKQGKPKIMLCSKETTLNPISRKYLEENLIFSMKLALQKDYFPFYFRSKMNCRLSNGFVIK